MDAGQRITIILPPVGPLMNVFKFKAQVEDMIDFANGLPIFVQEYRIVPKNGGFPGKKKLGVITEPGRNGQ